MDAFNPAWVGKRIAQTIATWESCSKKSNPQGRRYTLAEQAERERVYDLTLEEVERRYRQISPTERPNKGLTSQLIPLFARFAAQALDLPSTAINILTDDFLPIGIGLSRWARRFDAGLSMSEITQAARNAWTACGLQPLLGAKIALTPAIFGYSLIYPYSDNHLDDNQVNTCAKQLFSHRFRCRLLGDPLPAETSRETAIWALVSMIESEYPRAQFPQVFESLLCIHQAQEQSIGQLAKERSWDADDLLRLSCAKGGTSVLADACLVRGLLTAQESLFAFEWGVLLQIGDDLQDLKDDLQRGSQTLFTQAATSGKPLDEAALQLLQFAQSVGKRMDQLPCGTPIFKELLKMAWQSLILRALADSHEFFSAGFLSEMERFSPFRFEFLRSRSDRLASQHGFYTALFDDLLQGQESIASDPS